MTSRSWSSRRRALSVFGDRRSSASCPHETSAAAYIKVPQINMASMAMASMAMASMATIITVLAYLLPKTSGQGPTTEVPAASRPTPPRPW